MADEGVAHGFIVNMSAPLASESVLPAEPSALNEPEVSVLLCRISELIVGLPVTERLADNDSRTLEPEMFAAKFANSVVMSSTRSEVGPES